MTNLLNFLFPKKCFSCGKKGAYLCRSCRIRLTVLTEKQQRCPICDRASLSGLTHPSCKKPYGLDGIVSLYPFKPVIGNLLKEFKYHQVEDFGLLLADLSVSVLKKRDLLGLWRRKKFIFTPIPLFPARRLWRGFDQSQRILGQICDQLKLPFNPNILRRKKWTQEQAKLDSENRPKNVATAFELVKKGIVRGKNWVIFDDVVTTASTLKESGKVLKRSGANQVWALTLCR